MSVCFLEGDFRLNGRDHRCVGVIGMEVGKVEDPLPEGVVAVQDGEPGADGGDQVVIDADGDVRPGRGRPPGPRDSPWRGARKTSAFTELERALARVNLWASNSA